MKNFRFALWLVALTTCAGAAAQTTWLSADGPPTTLPAEPADLSVRFRHIQPRLDLPGLVACWPLDEASGYHAPDASGRGHDAWLTGTRWNTTASGLTASFRRVGRRGGGAYLDGTQWWQVRAAPTLPGGARSVGLWVRPDRRTAASLFSGKGLDLRTTESGAVRLLLTGTAGKPEVVETTPNRLRPRTWHYLTATADDRTLRLFVDGKLLAEKRISGFPKNTAAAEDLTLGQKLGEFQGFIGMLDEISLFDRALTEVEIQGLHLVGLPKLYTQTRATLDSARTVWAVFGGNQPVPHPPGPEGRLALSFDEASPRHQPGQFGAALDLRLLKTPQRHATALTGSRGTLELYLQPTAPGGDLLRLDGPGGPLVLGWKNGRWEISFSGKTTRFPGPTAPDAWPHLALVWEGPRLSTYLNGVPQTQEIFPKKIAFTHLDLLPGGGFLVDDLAVSATAKPAYAVYPHGLTATGPAALDPMDGFNHAPGTPMHRWQATSGAWAYAAMDWEDDGTHTGDGGLERRALRQSAATGLYRVFHPDASGFVQSIEAGVAVEATRDGWVGLFAGADSTAAFSGVTFALNPALNRLRLVAYRQGKTVAEWAVPCPFRLQPRRRYTLTLTLVNGLLRGYLDGHNVLTGRATGPLAEGQAGLFTENTPALFDDVHFSALTPSRPDSRQLQTRVWAGGLTDGWRAGFDELAHTAFRWHKRRGLLPWQTRGKNPEPPGNLFGPTEGTERPNPTAPWRSEDAANSDLLVWNGQATYVMRGNPDHGGPHGLAALGVLSRPADRFDGLHFTDVPGPGGLLRGHPELSPDCADAPPRHQRYQLNDQGMTVVGNRVVVVAREFRNRTAVGNRYKRLVYALLDPATGYWQTPEPRYADWSVMNAADCFDTLRGFDSTPEVFALREPDSGADVVFLFVKHATPGGVPSSGVVGLRLDGDSLRLHPGYPVRGGAVKASGDRIYGQRILFDNGIYYQHLNAGSGPERLARDWPDRFELYTALDPYAGPWTPSRAHADPALPYFSRGGPDDPDNGAIWQGTLFKHRNRYYLYYENFHVIENTEQAYDHYDAVHSGSRVGFATAN